MEGIFSDQRCFYRDRFLPVGDQMMEGSYGAVIKVWDPIDKRYCALKRTAQDETVGISRETIREAAIMKSICHPNVQSISKIFRFVGMQHQIYLQMDLAGSDLRKTLEANPSLFTPEKIKFFSFQLLQALDYCHSKQLVHRDIKPANILLFNSHTVKIADWGLGRQFIVPNKPYSPEVQTLMYRSPEVISKKFGDYFAEVDVWSIGIVVAEMACGGPFLKHTVTCENQLIEEWRRKIGDFQKLRGLLDLPYVPDLPSSAGSVQLALKFGEQLGRLIFGMLDYDPLTRMRPYEALLQDYFIETFNSVEVLEMYSKGEVPWSRDHFEARLKDVSNKASVCLSARPELPTPTEPGVIPASYNNISFSGITGSVNSMAGFHAVTPDASPMKLRFEEMQTT